MKVILFGATGMIGSGALIDCLGDHRVERVLAVVRTPTGRLHAKFEEVVHADFYDYPARVLEGRDINAAGDRP